jgi:hypothetical protein
MATSTVSEPGYLLPVRAIAFRYHHSIGTRHGSIIATIITTHIPVKDAPALAQGCPGIRIHIIDIVHPPGIDISPIAGIEVHQTMVAAALAAKTNAETPTKAYWEDRATSTRERSPVPVASMSSMAWLAAARCGTSRLVSATRPLRHPTP